MGEEGVGGSGWSTSHKLTAVVWTGKTMVVAGGMGEGWTACADHSGGDVPELNQTDHLSMRTVQNSCSDSAGDRVNR